MFQVVTKFQNLEDAQGKVDKKEFKKENPPLSSYPKKLVETFRRFERKTDSVNNQRFSTPRRFFAPQKPEDRSKYYALHRVFGYSTQECKVLKRKVKD